LYRYEAEIIYEAELGLLSPLLGLSVSLEDLSESLGCFCSSFTSGLKCALYLFCVEGIPVVPVLSVRTATVVSGALSIIPPASVGNLSVISVVCVLVGLVVSVFCGSSFCNICSYCILCRSSICSFSSFSNICSICWNCNISC